ncbi:MAG: 2-oxoacid:acceptor oxidoreductase family protein [Anaerolineae bacterium]|nr:2-oxoacid:acceptor oxidoreductase family protein [Anaerolineae bacterium]
MYHEIRLSGFGGQGIGLAGYLLGKALSLYENLEAVMTQAYGPEARGGASSANVVVSENPIDYPFVQHPDILVAMSQEAYTKFRPLAGPEALVLTDADLVTPFDDDLVQAIPATRLAEGLGRRIVANVIMLGFFTQATGVVSREAMEKALTDTLRPKLVPLNLKAFATGYAYQPDIASAP